MPVKTFTAQFEGHEILVVNTWFNGIALYIDGEEKDKNDGMISVKGTEPLLKASMEVNGKEKLIEVYVRAILFVRVKICADGEFIGGNNF